MIQTKIPISSFLKERGGCFTPSNPSLRNLKRLEKIDFHGNIHLSDKPSKTKMIIVKPGDLVISGINVSKGAIGIYDGKEPITATIHYSSYQFDSKKINISYFKRFVKSQAFLEELKSQVKSGIKTEIKAKHLLPLRIELPPIEKQIMINDFLDSLEQYMERLFFENDRQTYFLSNYRQSVLKEAIEGKLTADWRKQNPVIKGDPNYDAEALLEQIKVKKEKLIAEGKIKKQKTLPPIREEEIPYDIPEGWVWCRLGEIIKNPPKNGFSPKAVSYKTKVKNLKLGATTKGIFNPNEYKYIDKEIAKNSALWLESGDILIQRSNSRDYVGVSAIFVGEKKEFIYPDLMMKIQVLEPISVDFIHSHLSSPMSRNYYKENAKGAQKSMPKINQNIVNCTLIPLPPLAEEQAIIKKLDKSFMIADLLGQQVSDRKALLDTLTHIVLKEAFNGD